MLVQNNQLVSLKRKRPLLLNTNGAQKKNLFQHIVKEPADNHHHKVPHSRTEGLKARERISDDIIIYDVTDDNADEENIPVIPELMRMLYLIPPTVASTLILSLLKITTKMSMHLSFRVEIRMNQPENP